MAHCVYYCACSILIRSIELHTLHLNRVLSTYSIPINRVLVLFSSELGEGTWLCTINGGSYNTDSTIMKTSKTMSTTPNFIADTEVVKDQLKSNCGINSNTTGTVSNTCNHCSTEKRSSEKNSIIKFIFYA